MPLLKSNVWYKPLLTSIVLMGLAVCSAASVQANNNGGGTTGGTAGGTTGGTGSGGSDLVDLQEEFIGDIDRTGGVGQFSEPVGASATSSAASLGTTGARTTRGVGGLGGLGAAFNNTLDTGLGASESVIPLRTRLRSAVALPPRKVEDQVAVVVNVNNRLQGTSTLGPRPRARGMIIPGASYGTPTRPHAGVSVQMQGRTAVLQGTVSSHTHRRMSELLMRLEPGVSAVDNQISVVE